ncbi:hypothetical protein [Sporolituus thermophilus]|uniref:Uncharacterized protein n=1 Tax=Sporolituus thermophilus DSM 23256 TaxID=1123285 RepID=A0A1G7I6J5_9FIRM|nr:hypothetical protein [Sporolituus thermophilus]SDF08341.1 hypothetical protein SAMN05660235_00371 [Sporolituus thermophilus DSM 23256]
MVELQHIHLTSYRTSELHNILALMQLQNTYINRVYRIIYNLCTDFNVASNIEFQEFTMHFNLFVRYQAGGEGYSQALDAMQVYCHALLEKLLDTQVMAAEQLELAVGHLELAAREVKVRTNPQMLLLNQAICLLEETELKIIEALEGILQNAKSPELQN